MTKRYSKYTDNHKCHACRRQLSFSYYKFRIPKKTDKKGWIELKRKVGEFNGEIRLKRIQDCKIKINEFKDRLRIVDERDEKLVRILEEKIQNQELEINNWSNWK